MITNEQIRIIITDCKNIGYNVGMRDIAYIILCDALEDASTAYRILFGLDKDFDIDMHESYSESESIRHLRRFVENMDGSPIKRGKRMLAGDDISFEENKSEIIKLIQRTKELLASGEIEAKDALKIESDLRVKLNDKFNVQSDKRSQVIYVQPKYSHICEITRKECFFKEMTKEEAMRKYNLVEKQ